MIKTRADLFEAAAKMMRMCDEAGIDHCVKIDERLHSFSECTLTLCPDRYKFPLAIVEGRPVFVGDELYDCSGYKYRVEIGAFINTQCYSWNPPKPKTVMVELLREDAEYWSIVNDAYDKWLRLKDACRKSLENSKK